MADTIRGVCPQCGKKLEIPAELEEFSCLYCGARMRTEALRAKPMEERAVEALLAQLPGCITRYPDLHLRIGKKDFFPTFAQYEQDNAPLLQELVACCAGYPGGAVARAGPAAAVMLDGLAAQMEPAQAELVQQAGVSGALPCFLLQIGGEPGGHLVVASGLVGDRAGVDGVGDVIHKGASGRLDGSLAQVLGKTGVGWCGRGRVAAQILREAGMGGGLPERLRLGRLGGGIGRDRR